MKIVSCRRSSNDARFYEDRRFHYRAIARLLVSGLDKAYPPACHSGRARGVIRPSRLPQHGGRLVRTEDLRAEESGRVCSGLVFSANGLRGGSTLLVLLDDPVLIGKVAEEPARIDQRTV